MNYKMSTMEINRFIGKALKKTITWKYVSLSHTTEKHITCINPSYAPTDSLNEELVDLMWDELMLIVNEDGNQPQFGGDEDSTKWQYLIQKHECTKAEAVCICFIEYYETKC